MEQQKKKRHAGRTILLILLAIVLLIPAAAYGYLTLCGFHPAEMRENAAVTEARALERRYAADGSVTVRLGESELYRLGEAYEADKRIEEALPDFVAVEAWSVALRAGGADVYADGRLWGFVPVPVRVSADVSFEKGDLTVIVREVRLGKWLSLPLERLYGFGLPEKIEVSLNSGADNEKLQNIVFTANGVEVTDRVLDALLPGIYLDARPYAKMLTAYGLDLPDASALIETAAQLVEPEVKNADLCRMLAESDDPDRTLLTLLALYRETQTLARLNVLEPIEREYIVPFTEEEIAERRMRVMMPLANKQFEYEVMLRALREKYKQLALTLDDACLIDNETGEPLVLSALCPELEIDDAASRVIILHSFDALHAVNTYGMPLLDAVPKTSGKATGGAYAYIPYDLGVMTVLPSGLKAVLYYEADKTLIINCIDEVLYQELLTVKYQPYRLSDDLPKPTVRVRLPAPDAGSTVSIAKDPPHPPALIEPLSSFALLLPYEVTSKLP